MSHVLVTGSAGFIGSHLVDRLLAEGHDVTGLDNFTSSARVTNLEQAMAHPRFRQVAADVCSNKWQDMSKLGGRPDLIFHLASSVGVAQYVKRPEGTIRGIINGSMSVLDFAESFSVPVIYASTSEVYGSAGKLGVGLSESDSLSYGPPTESRWCYGMSKAVVEHIALAAHDIFGLESLGLRFFNVIGARQVGTYGLVVPRFVKAALNGQPLNVHGNGSQTRSFVWVHDVVRLMMHFVDNGIQGLSGKVANVGNPEAVTINELAHTIAAMCGSISPIVHTDPVVDYGKGFAPIEHRSPDITFITRETGWSPSKETMTLGLEDAIDYLIHAEGIQI